MAIRIDGSGHGGSVSAFYGQGRHESRPLPEQDAQFNISHHSLPTLKLYGLIQELRSQVQETTFLFLQCRKMLRH